MIDPSKKLRFYGQFRWPVDRILYTQYFSNFEGQGICLECGAADGVTIRWRKKAHGVSHRTSLAVG